MAIVRKTLEQIMAEAAQRSPEENAAFRHRIAATTEEDIRRHMIEDGEDPDEELREDEIFTPAVIRKRLGMTQEQFARALHIPVATLRNWEQRRVMPDPAAISLLRIVAKEPEMAFRALGRAPEAAE